MIKQNIIKENIFFLSAMANFEKVKFDRLERKSSKRSEKVRKTRKKFEEQKKFENKKKVRKQEESSKKKKKVRRKTKKFKEQEKSSKTRKRVERKKTIQFLFFHKWTLVNVGLKEMFRSNSSSDPKKSHFTLKILTLRNVPPILTN